MQKLENLEVTKVAFVPEGDNKNANVLFFKSKPAGEQGEPPDNPDGLPNPKSGENSGSQGNPAPTAKNKETQEGDVVDVNIDKSKLTAEELTQLEALEKKAGIPNNVDNTPEPNTSTGTTQKAAESNDSGEDIYKGLHPAVAAELKELRKRADAAEERELMEVAKKYEIIGKKPDELAKTLKSLKATGGTAYDDMISVLDSTLTMVEKSGLFNEIGKSGSGNSGNHLDAWGQIEKHADEIMKAAPNMSRTEAIDKACMQHTDLLAEYESEKYGG